MLVHSGTIDRTRIATTYLYGHAVELAMKSMLAKSGLSFRELRSIGHDLEECLEKASLCPEGQYITQSLRGIVGLLNPEYEMKNLEYHSGIGYMRLPDESVMCTEIGCLIDRLDQIYRRDLRLQG